MFSQCYISAIHIKERPAGSWMPAKPLQVSATTACGHVQKLRPEFTATNVLYPALWVAITTTYFAIFQLLVWKLKISEHANQEGYEIIQTLSQIRWMTGVGKNI